MPVLAFDMTTANHESRRFEFRGKNKTDYYDGDLSPISPLEVDMKIEKCQAGQYGIYRLTSRSGLAFRRTWTHIRHDNTALTLFWFVRRGQITLSHSGSRHTSRPGDCFITRSSQAFYMEMMPDVHGGLEAMHVVVPSHELRALLGNHVEMGQPFSASKGDLHLAEQLFMLVFAESDDLDAGNAEALVQAMVTGLARTIGNIVGDPGPPPTIADRRIEQILHCINQDFPNLDLNAKTVAQKCGISLRYLCHLLKDHSLSFSKLLWERRIAAAEQWLSEEAMRYNSIGVIACLAGFKSTAHFSRMFKLRHGIAPSQFRTDRLRGDAGPDMAA